MSTSTDLVFRLIGKDETGKAFRSVGDGLGKLGRDADDAGKRSESAFSRIGKSAGIAAAALGGIAAAGAIAGIKSATREASELGESINAVNVTFGTAATGIQELGKTSATSLGLSRSEFNALAVRFSSFATTVAGSGGDVSKTMRDLTGRSADFASVMNIDVAKAAELFQSGLAGETEPLRAYGIDLSAATVQQYALSHGIASSASEMTEAQKVQARYGLLMEQTNKTAGDFANTSNSQANQLRILKSRWTDLEATTGQAFKPLVEAALPKVNLALGQVMTLIEANMPTISTFMTGLGTQLGDAAQTAIDKWPQVQTVLGNVADTVRANWPEIKQTIETVADSLKRTGEMVGALWDAFKAMPPEVQQTILTLAVLQKTGVIDVQLVIKSAVSTGVGGLLGSILGGPAAGLGAAITLPVTIGAIAFTLSAAFVYNSDWFSQVRQVVFGDKSFQDMITDGFKDLFSNGVVAGVMSIPGVLAQTMAFIAPEIKRIMLQPFTEAWDGIKTTVAFGVAWIGANISQGMGNVGTIWSTAWSTVGTTVSTVWDWITARVSGAMSWVGQVVSVAMSVIAGAWSQAWSGIGTTVSTVWDWITARVSGAMSWVGSIISGAMAFISGLWSGGWDGIKSIASGAWDAITNGVRGALDGVSNLFRGAVDGIGRIWGNITEAVKGPVRGVLEFIRDKMVGPINSIMSTVGASPIDFQVPQFHTGGYTGDKLAGREGLALLRNDEYVMSPQATARFRPILEALNAADKGYGIGGPGVAGTLVGWLQGQGLGNAGIAGILGNFQAESSLNPFAVEPNGGGHGLAQWTGSRWNDLQAFAQQRRTVWEDLNTQIAFLAQELSGYGALMSSLRTATDPVLASEMFATGFERPGVYGQRDEFAQQFFQQLQSGELTASSESGLSGGILPSIGNAIGSMMRGAVSPLLDLLVGQFGGSWAGKAMTGMVRKAIDAVFSWGDSHSSSGGGSGSSFGGVAGAWRIPLAQYDVTSEYGWRVSPTQGGDPVMHQGIDLGAPAGTPVLAAADGLVQFAAWNNGYGNMVRIDHGSGLATEYGHMSAINTALGNIVKMGDQIGAVGTTGDSTGNHLHFNTLTNGQYENPRDFMGARGLSFDSGGWLDPGLHTVYNGTGKPEPVLTSEQWSRMGGGQQVVVQIDGRVLHESLVRYRRAQGGAPLGLG